jgi:hypothetical protein
MLNASRLADKYILSDGSSPLRQRGERRTVISTLDDQGKIGEVTSISYFIAFQTKGASFGGFGKDEVWASWCKLLDIKDADGFYEVIRKRTPKTKKPLPETGGGSDRGQQGIIKHGQSSWSERHHR